MTNIIIDNMETQLDNDILYIQSEFSDEDSVYHFFRILKNLMWYQIKWPDETTKKCMTFNYGNYERGLSYIDYIEDVFEIVQTKLKTTARKAVLYLFRNGNDYIRNITHRSGCYTVHLLLGHKRDIKLEKDGNIQTYTLSSGDILYTSTNCKIDIEEYQTHESSLLMVITIDKPYSVE